MMDADGAVRIPDRARHRSRPRAAWRAAVRLSRARRGRRHPDVPAARHRRDGQEGRRDDAGRGRDRQSPTRTASMSRTSRAPSSSAIRGRHERDTAMVGDAHRPQGIPADHPPQLALYCGASGDHNPIHVDLDFARQAGFPDVFAHGMLVMAYLGQALTDAVPPSRIRSFSTRFAAITPARRATDLRGPGRRAVRAQWRDASAAGADDQG